MFQLDLNSLLDFIKPFAAIYLQEPLFAFHEDANFAQAYPEEWLNFSLNLDIKEKYSFVCGNQTPANAPASLQNFEKLRQSIIKIPKEKNKAKIDTLNLKVKKAHELERLLAYLPTKMTSTKTIYDFAGGAGHLSRLLAPTTKAEVTTLDFDETLLKKGEALNSHKNLIFKKINLFAMDEFTPKSDTETYTIGLHTCGELSRAQMDFNLKHKIPYLLNIGCCYLRLNPKAWPWSDYLKSKKITLNQFALTLATNGNVALSEQAFIHSKKVKSYRYALACYLKWEQGQNVFKEVGESAKTLYQKDFSYYFSQKTNLNIEMNDFYHSNKVRETVDKLWAMDCIRWRLARVLEFLITRDRQQYLFENGIATKLKEIFEENKSPRNLMIVT